MTRPAATSLPLAGGRRLPFGDTPRLFGIINVTPDSFSDGGQYFDPERAIDHGLRLLEEGADVLDLGAESTRPGGGVYGAGSTEVAPEEEIARLLPVVRGLRRRAPDAVLSIDTRKGVVAEAMLSEGADLINDVGGLSDSALRRAVARAGCGVVAMHSRGELASMQRDISFDDVVAEVASELGELARGAEADGLAREQIVLDPGIGFGKTATQNFALLSGLPRLAELGYPVLVGASRKSFLATAIGGGGEPPPPGKRLPGSLAAAGWSARARVEFLRVHDVGATVAFLAAWNAIDSTR